MFHFVKLRHNVTVFTRDDPFHMGDVMHPYFWKGFRRAGRTAGNGVSDCAVAGWVLQVSAPSTHAQLLLLRTSASAS